MATYQINQKNTHFSGEVGDLIVMDPGEFANAAVISGILSRTDTAEPQPDDVEHSDDVETLENAEPAVDGKKKK